MFYNPVKEKIDLLVQQNAPKSDVLNYINSTEPSFLSDTLVGGLSSSISIPSSLGAGYLLYSNMISDINKKYKTFEKAPHLMKFSSVFLPGVAALAGSIIPPIIALRAYRNFHKNRLRGYYESKLNSGNEK